MDCPDEVLTTTEVMAYLRVTRKTVLKLVHEQRLPAGKVGKDFRFLKSEVDKFLKGETREKELNYFDM